MKFSLSTREALQHYVVLAGFQPIQYLLPATRYPYSGSELRWEFVGQDLEDHCLRGKRLFNNGKPLQANQKRFGYIN